MASRSNNKIIFISLFFISGLSFSQSSSVVFNNSVILDNGIYSCFGEILKNSPKYPDCTLKIQNQLLDTAYYLFVDPNSVEHEYNDNLYAVVDDGTLYIRLHKGFYKLIIKGTISVFYKELKYSYYPTGYTFSEDHIFIVDFMNGNIKKLNLKNLEKILVRDNSLYEEFSKISNSKKKNSLLPYILNYNDRNPVLME